MVAIAVISLIASIVVVNLANPLGDANHESAKARLAEFDLQTRELARAKGKPVDLVFDLSDNLIYRQDPQSGDLIASKIKLPGDAKIAQLLVRGQSLVAGTMSIRCSRSGLTPTYAVKIETPNAFPTWLLVAGTTGQFTELKNESEIEQIWTQAILGRDAD